MVFHDRFGINHVFSLCDGYAIGLERMKRCPVGMPFYMINRHRINVFPQNELSGACNGRTIKPAFLCDLYRVESRKTAYGRSRVFGEIVEGFQEKGRGFSGKGSRVFGKRVEGFREKDNFCPSLPKGLPRQSFDNRFQNLLFCFLKGQVLPLVSCPSVVQKSKVLTAACSRFLQWTLQDTVGKEVMLFRTSPNRALEPEKSACRASCLPACLAITRYTCHKPADKMSDRRQKPERDEKMRPKGTPFFHVPDGIHCAEDGSTPLRRIMSRSKKVAF